MMIINMFSFLFVFSCSYAILFSIILFSLSGILCYVRLETFNKIDF